MTAIDTQLPYSVIPCTYDKQIFIQQLKIGVPMLGLVSELFEIANTNIENGLLSRQFCVDKVRVETI